MFITLTLRIPYSRQKEGLFASKGSKLILGSFFGCPIVADMDPQAESLIQPVTLKKLYPGLDDSQLEEIEQTLEQYIEVVLRIYNRLQLEKKVTEPPSLTPFEKEPTMVPRLS